MPKISISAGPIRITIRASVSVRGNAHPGRRRTRRRSVATVLAVLAGLGAAAVALALLVSFAVGSGHGGNAAGTGGGAFSPAVVRTRRPPTGYTVTFRYRDPSATSVQLEGEWFFSSPARTSPSSSQELLPSQWKPGDFPIGSPNNTSPVGDGWPVVSMTEDRASGVWSYTIPLPSGDFNYGFLLNCPSAIGRNSFATNCPERSDPSNPPWNERNGVTVGTVEPTSQVYVPSDPAFRTGNDDWQAPTSPRGALADVSYPPDLGSPEPSGYNRLAIYTPPGYDRHRATPYPTLYLGIDQNEVDWSTRDDAANILDNLIDKHEIKPLVAVMTAFDFDCQGDDAGAFAQNLSGQVLPYAQSRYDVSREPSQRAFLGASCGGGAAAAMLVNDPSTFGYMGVISAIPDAVVSGAQARAIKHVGVMVGGGKQDPLHYLAAQEVSDLHHAGVKFTADFINGGDSWYVWRILLRDFLTRVAFKPTGG
jgi:enterochelin esterase-like enzyme